MTYAWAEKCSPHLLRAWVREMPTPPFDNTVPPTDRADRNLVAWSLLAGVLLWGALAGPFFAGRIYTADDLGAFHLPVRAFYAEQLAAGQSYDWMPQLFSGFYLTAEGQGGAYHPLHQLLYRFFSLRAALGLEYLLPYPAMMLGMWLLLRRRLGRSDAAMLGGFLFAFSTFNLLHFIHPNAVAVIAHIPWLLWAIDVVLLDARPRRVALASALIALLTGSQLLLGYPQYVWFSLMAEFSYVVFILVVFRHASGVEPVARRLPRIVIAKGIGILIGGVQLLPTLDGWLNSARPSVDADFALWGSLHPLNLLQLVAPYMFSARIVGDSTHEFGLYVGAVPLMLIVWMLTRRRQLGSLAPLAYASLGFALLMLLLGFGRYGNVYRVMTWLPLLRSFRLPCRHIVLFQLAVAVLAAIGFLLLIRQSRGARQPQEANAVSENRRSWRTLWHGFEPLWCVVGLSVAVALVGVWLRDASYIAPVSAVLAGPVLLALAALLLAWAAQGRTAALAALIVLAACDLGWYGLSYSAYRQNATLDAYVASAHTPPGVPDGRVVGSLLHITEPGMRVSDLMTLRGWSRADGYAGLEPSRRLDYRLLPALRVAGVRWVQRNGSTDAIAGLKPCGDLWMEVPDPLPRVRLVTQTQMTGNPAVDIARVCPDTTALCETPIALPASKPGKVALVDERPGRFVMEVDCPAPQLLVVAESYHNGWRAAVDGRPQELYRINGDFMGCTVGPGKRRVVFTFQPSSLERGRLTSYVGLSMLSICLLGAATRSKPVAAKEPLS